MSVARYQGEMKDSGIEYLSSIPKDWKPISIGRIGRFSKGNGLSKKELVPTGIPCIRYGEIYTKHNYLLQQFYSFIPRELANNSIPLQKGDILFAASGETLEEIGKSIAYLGEEEAYIGGDIVVFRPQKGISSHFLGYALDSHSAISQKSQMGRGITVMHIYSSSLKNLKIALPPLPTQQLIATYLDRKTQAIDALITAREEQIARLQEKLQTAVERPRQRLGLGGPPCVEAASSVIISGLSVPA